MRNFSGATVVKYLKSIILIIAAASSSGCANLASIDRATKLPGGGKAIHLDAQQRLMIANQDGTYCSEPSPDAIAAYASALGASGASPEGTALGASGAGGSNVASFGLRTQSISIMRDIIMQTCVQGANNKIGQTEVAKLLNKSLDLTALNVAVEQLTGPVIGGQAGLSTTSSADSSAALSNVTKLYEESSRHLAIEERRLERSITAVQNKDKEIVTTEQEIAEISGRITKLEEQAGSGADALAGAAAVSNAGDLASEKALKTQKSQDLEELKTQKTALEGVRDRQIESVDARRAFIDELKDAQDAAVIANSASTTGTSKISGSSTTGRMSDAAIEKVAVSVQTMVTDYFKKDYTIETCLSFLTSDFERRYNTEQFKELPDAVKTDIVTKDENIKAVCLGLLVVKLNRDGKASGLSSSDIQTFQNMIQ